MLYYIYYVGKIIIEMNCWIQIGNTNNTNYEIKIKVNLMNTQIIKIIINNNMYLFIQSIALKF